MRSSLSLALTLGILSLLVGCSRPKPMAPLIMDTDIIKATAEARMVEVAAARATLTLATPTGTPLPTRLVVANTDGQGVFIRQSAGGTRIKAWPDATVMAVVGEPRDAEGRRWMNVRDPSGNVGWIPTEYLAVPPPTRTPTPTRTQIRTPTPTRPQTLTQTPPRTPPPTPAATSTRATASTRVTASTPVPSATPNRSVYELELVAGVGTRAGISGELAVVEGVVKNISTKPIVGVKAVVISVDKNEKVIATQSAPIQYDPIPPGQTSPYRVSLPDDPDMAKYRISFVDSLGTRIPTLDPHRQ